LAKSAASHINLYNAAFDHKQLSQLTTRNIQDFQTTQLAAGKTPASVNCYLVVLE
jgi:hypothetical protein